MKLHIPGGGGNKWGQVEGRVGDETGQVKGSVGDTGEVCARGSLLQNLLIVTFQNGPRRRATFSTASVNGRH
jgi:hypothetical protein